MNKKVVNLVIGSFILIGLITSFNFFDQLVIGIFGTDLVGSFLILVFVVLMLYTLTHFIRKLLIGISSLVKK